MPAKPSLFNRVASLYARGNTKLLQIVNKIRATKGGRSINVRYIRANYYKHLATLKAAEGIGKVKGTTPINQAMSKDAGKGSQTVRVGYHVFFDFPSSSKSGKQGRNAVYFIADLPGDTTKASMLQTLRDRVKDWIEQHYESDGGNQTSFRIVIDNLKGD